MILYDYLSSIYPDLIDWSERFRYSTSNFVVNRFTKRSFNQLNLYLDLYAILVLGCYDTIVTNKQIEFMRHHSQLIVWHIFRRAFRLKLVKTYLDFTRRSANQQVHSK